jgi:hypothetical protein
VKPCNDLAEGHAVETEAESGIQAMMEGSKEYRPPLRTTESGYERSRERAKSDGYGWDAVLGYSYSSHLEYV